MNEPYFVMLLRTNGEYFLPLVDDDDELMQFDTKQNAVVGAESSFLGAEVGYEIFCFGEGS